MQPHCINELKNQISNKKWAWGYVSALADNNKRNNSDAKTVVVHRIN